MNNIKIKHHKKATDKLITLLKKNIIRNKKGYTPNAMQPSLTNNQKRIESIDLLRGFVMIIMALDHTRDYFHIDAFTGNPLNPETTNAALYFTRWITHFCAPTFVFLSGVSAWLQSRRKTTKQLSRFLITRGLWLIIMELTIINFGLSGDIYFGFFMLQTIWAIGISMVILGLVIWLPFNLILAIGLVIVFGHNTMDFAEKEMQGNIPVWWSFLHSPTVLALSAGHSLGVFYPFLPWTGLMILGYCCGKIFTTIEPVRRKKILLWMGLGLLLLFVVLRAINIYGDPVQWSQQKTSLQTFYSFMNVQKYPPSLLFISVTMAGAFFFLVLAKNTETRMTKIIQYTAVFPFFIL